MKYKVFKWQIQILSDRVRSAHIELKYGRIAFSTIIPNKHDGY
jgi:hypothetical protein